MSQQNNFGTYGSNSGRDRANVILGLRPKKRGDRDPTHDSVLVTKRNINPKLRVAANNATARNAGVRLGGLYRTAAGVVMVRTV